jgi:hypothetical protein
LLVALDQGLGLVFLSVLTYYHHLGQTKKNPLSFLCVEPESHSSKTLGSGLKSNILAKHELGQHLKNRIADALL